MAPPIPPMTAPAPEICQFADLSVGKKNRHEHYQGEEDQKDAEGLVDLGIVKSFRIILILNHHHRLLLSKGVVDDEDYG
jgi:hypothetical protein